MYDMVQKMYLEKGMDLEFHYDIAKDLCEWADRIQFLGMYTTDAQRQKFVFIHRQGVPAHRLYFQFGDHLFNKLSTLPAIQMEMSNIMFDVIDQKGEPGHDPVIHADGNRTITLFKLKEGLDGDSMKDS
ncbi:hypothetical protein D3C79_888570 [compost metagenome]